MSWTLVDLQKVPALPWRNGGGLTRELLAWPDAAEWRVRMSVAEVRSCGPFSRFDGIERWFAVLEGDGLILRSNAARHHLSVDSEPFSFDGALPIDCALVLGPTRDFNLMAAPGRARMQRVRGEDTVRGEGGSLLALYTHATEARLQCDDGTVDLPPYHLAWQQASAALQGRVQAKDALWMEAQP